MSETPAGVVHHFPGAPNRASLTLPELADVYMANFSGRDHTRVYTVAFWTNVLGDCRLVDIDADVIADVLEGYATALLTKYAGKDDGGKPILRKHARKSARGRLRRLTG